MCVELCGRRDVCDGVSDGASVWGAESRAGEYDGDGECGAEWDECWGEWEREWEWQWEWREWEWGQ